MNKSLRLWLALPCLCSSAMARDGAALLEEAVRKGVTVVSPIFGQIVAFSLPAGFRTVFENTKGDSYIREAVPDGQSVERWSQMITVTGARGLAAKIGSARAFAEAIAGGFGRNCPDSFSLADLGPATVGGFEAHALVASCGTVRALGGGGHSETALIFAARASADVYSLQWAEVGAPSARPLPVDAEKWRDRRARLEPIRVCPIVPGETAPYPSCVERK